MKPDEGTGRTMVVWARQQMYIRFAELKRQDDRNDFINLQATRAIGSFRFARRAGCVTHRRAEAAFTRRHVFASRRQHVFVAQPACWKLVPNGDRYSDWTRGINRTALFKPPSGLFSLGGKPDRPSHPEVRLPSSAAAGTFTHLPAIRHCTHL